tara:strand:- start:3777 stop:4148 length:372 start_codon:yes stop_codon:yes gene_type:complete
VYIAKLGVALCEEYSHRYGGKRHLSETLLRALLKVPLRIVDIKIEFVETTTLALWPLNKRRRLYATVPLCMPDYCKVKKKKQASCYCALSSYRKYYRREKSQLKRGVNWKKRGMPAWFDNVKK